MRFIYLSTVLFIILYTPTAAATNAGQWQFALGYGFLSQADEVQDTYRHRLRLQNNHDHIYNTSVSLSFQPYFQWENGFRAGAGVGPLVLFTGDAYHFELPVNATLGYSFLNTEDVIPYFRAGISYHLASGDYYARSSGGFYGAVGCQLLKNSPVRLALETAYDGATITLDPETDNGSHDRIKTGELTFYIYADF